MEDTRVASTPKNSAPYVGWGVFLTLAGLPLVLAASTLIPAPSDPAPLVWAGLAVVVLGAALLAWGLFCWAEHADRAAGITFPGRPNTGWIGPVE